ncbi:DUF87 domain-containing protein [archaeon]|jgi:hypothetical protein|nr:DUF87 domain-containing protein [archaeon]
MIQRQITIEEISKKLKPIFGNKIDQLYFKYISATSIDERNEIAQVLNALYQKHLSKLLDQGVLLEPPRENLVSGEYPLATVSYAKKKLFTFGLRESDWPRHMCVTGMSGSGKTTFAYSILTGFMEKDKPFLVLDWKKSFRPLLGVDPSLMCFTVGNDKVSNLFKLNINIPPKGVEPKEWINVLCDILTESFCASFGVHKILLETLDEIYEGWGVYEGGKHYPNWQHVKKMLENKAAEAKGRETGWYESALRIASVLTFGSFGKVVNYDGKKSVSIEDLFDKKVILELNSLGNIEKKFFCEYILTYMYKLRKAKQNNNGNKFDYAILVDEAHNVFLKNSTHFVAESVTDMVYREMREYGVSLICLDQHISKLSDTVKGNSACHVAFQQQLPQDIDEISALMMLKEKKEYFSQLPVGSAIVKLAERHTFPFLVEAPLIDLRNQVLTDGKIAHRMECMIQGLNVEKTDPDFQKAIESPEQIILEQPKTEKEQVVEIVLETPEINVFKDELSKEVPKLSKLNEKQEVLYEFAGKELIKGKSLYQIEKLLEQGLRERSYTMVDILIVINHALNNKFLILNPKKEKQKVFRKENKFNQEQEKFMKFLNEMPDHNYTTVEFYKRIGLSTRKGNNVKNELLKSNLIQIKEEKNTKGWRKVIRLF